VARPRSNTSSGGRPPRHHRQQMERPRRRSHPDQHCYEPGARPSSSLKRTRTPVSLASSPARVDVVRLSLVERLPKRPCSRWARPEGVSEVRCPRRR
jgi:hypothetical protein